MSAVHPRNAQSTPTPIAVADGGTGSTTAAAARTALGIVNTGGWPSGLFGSGADGAFDLDGTNTYAGKFSKSGNVYTMDRNVLATTVRVRNGCTLVKKYVLFVNDTLTVDSGGIVSDDGAAASGGTAGAAISATTRLPESGSGAGAAGRNTTGTGASASNVVDSYGGAGGTGAISGGGNNGGTGGSVTEPTAQNNSLRGVGFLGGFWLMSSGTATMRAGGGSGGGAGGCTVGAGTATSGGGGGGAPVSILFAKNIANSGTIRCNGGSGGAAVAAGGGAAGGGSGGGGGYLIVYTNTALASAGTVQANGGAGGAGAGGGSTGADGGNGTVDWRGP